MKYKILIDNGKPYEETANTDEDITESQFISELIGGILENED